MNKYIEKLASFVKEALNAQKARQMAKQVGVIADPSSAWKWGLRQLRDGRGNALQGQALEKARTRMGAMDSGSFKQLRDAQARSPDREISYHVQKGKVSDISAGEHKTVSIDPENYRHKDRNLDGYIGHTHHGVGFNQGAYPHHVTLPSGYHEHDLRRPNGEFGRIFKKNVHDANFSTRLRGSLIRDIKEGHIGAASAGKIWQRLSPKTLSAGDQGRDVHHAILHPNKVLNDIYGISNSSIANTTQGVEALHRSVGLFNGSANEAHLLKHRTVFLKHK